MSEDESDVEVESEDDEIEAEVEREDVSREEVADHLEAFAGTLREGGPFDVEIDGESVTIAPPDSLEFEVEIEDEREDDGVERSIEFELEWDRSDDEDPLLEE
ncbi:MULTISPECIES: amphi-Trp domain-containing protein [Saliphagus]|uniref:Amphi-Trp domain-containing protein n=1 Tax=Saliphagus infecundisoli TaxID=1849069 RepID=A0ABD5QD56_9EURY|nr:MULTISPECIES: amphi-Trp domain-containing protein [Saliphagus]